MVMFAEMDAAAVERWAYSSELDARFACLEEEDGTEFQRALYYACSLSVMLRYAADPQCLKRVRFAWLLAQQLCGIFRASRLLPFHFSRFMGIRDRAGYLAEAARSAERIYALAEIIEAMRLSADPALQALARMLLDFRHDHADVSLQAEADLLKRIHDEILPLFATA